MIKVITGKSTSNILGLTLHSNKEVLLLFIREKFKELIGERLYFLERKYNHKFNLII